MESLTPFIRHELEDAPGPSGPPEETSSVVSPPLGAESIADFNKAEAGSTVYRLTGVITKVANAKFGNCYIKANVCRNTVEAASQRVQILISTVALSMK